MIKLTIVIAVIVIGTYLGVSYLISSGEVDKYFDAHPEYEWTPTVEYYIGQFNVVCGKWDKAIYRFSRIVEEYPSRKIAPAAQFALASIYDQRGQTKLALREYQKLLDLYPSSPDEDVAKKRIMVLR
jgi:TolA-binding protein